ncbi:MAG: NUDIX domain-containing protein [Rhodospirillaceae bacterium]|nr:NUDIX domain-containing protein [Rhodospirillaceae bacterium]
MKSGSIFVDDTSPLIPGDAVAAILISPDNKFLLQLRDDKAGIFYPGHWGLFGGALETDDPSPAEGLRRELHEELSIDLPAASLTAFTTQTFDFSFAGRDILNRQFFVGHLSAAHIPALRLGEGSAFRLFTPAEALSDIRLVPYDAFALWMWYARNRLRA